MKTGSEQCDSVVECAVSEVCNGKYWLTASDLVIVVCHLLSEPSLGNRGSQGECKSRGPLASISGICRAREIMDEVC